MTKTLSSLKVPDKKLGVQLHTRLLRPWKVSIFQSFMAYEVQNWIIYEVDGVVVAMTGFNKIAL